MSNERLNEIKKITIWGAIVNVVFGALKVIYGFLAGSQAMIADGIHSLSDLVTDFLVLIVSLKSNEDADEEHPYGHQRFETVGSAALAGLLLSVAAIIGWENVNSLIEGEFEKSFSIATLVVTITSILAKEILFYATLRVGKKQQSQMIIANAWHTRSDSLSSLAVLIGIIFNYFGILWVDNVAAIVVSAILAHIGFDILKSSIHVLTDRQVEDKKLNDIKAVINNCPGIVDYHNLRTRYMGEKIFIDLNAQVAPRITVSEGHEIAAVLTKKLLESSRDIQDVTIHIDVEDDQEVPFQNFHTKARPLRNELIEIIGNVLDEDFKNKIIDYRLSYLSGKIQIGIIVKHSDEKESDIIAMTKLKGRIQDEVWYGNLQLIYIKDF